MVKYVWNELSYSLQAAINESKSSAHSFYILLSSKSMIFLMYIWGGYLMHGLIPPETEVAAENKWKPGGNDRK
jgi:hypothetical protein